MYYEVYVDVLFVKNFWMDALLLLLTAWIWQKRIRLPRLLLAAGAGSLGACLMAAASAHLSGIIYFLGTFFLAAGMTWILFGTGGSFWPYLGTVYLEGFLLNGMLSYLNQFYPMAGFYFGVFSGISFLVLLLAEYLRNKKRAWKSRIFKVLLIQGEKEFLVEGLYDTGNGLYDPVSGKQVCILSQSLFGEFLEQPGQETKFRVIPYRTISESGILRACVLDRMVIRCSGEDRIVEKPLIACMPGGHAQYQLILHRDMLAS